MTEVVVVGAAGLDTCVYLGPDGFDPTRDSSFTDNRDGVGQAGGYASRSYGALGHATAYCGAIADDPAGRAVGDALRGDGIDLSTCFDDPAGTARSVNMMTTDGRRTAFYDGRGNPHLAPDLEPLRDVLHGCRLCHVNIPNWARGALPLARAAGATVLVDLQDVHSADDAYRADFVAGADIVCFSTAHVGEPEPFIAAVWRRHPRLVLLAGMGAAGCAVGADRTVRRFPAPASELPIVDTNGAGDALAAGFASAYVLDGLGIDAAADRGQRAARIIASQRTPKGWFATRADLPTS